MVWKGQSESSVLQVQNGTESTARDVGTESTQDNITVCTNTEEPVKLGVDASESKYGCRGYIMVGGWKYKHDKPEFCHIGCIGKKKTSRIPKKTLN